MIGDMLTSLQSGLVVENNKSNDGEAPQLERLFSEVLDNSQKSIPLPLSSGAGNDSVKALSDLSVTGALVGGVEGDTESVVIVDAQSDNINEDLSSNGDNFPTVLLGNHAIIRESLAVNSGSINDKAVVMASDLIKSVTDADNFSKSVQKLPDVGDVIKNQKSVPVSGFERSTFADYLSMDERRLSANKVSAVGNVENQTPVLEFVATTEYDYFAINQNKLNSVVGSEGVTLKKADASPLESRFSSLSETKEHLGFSQFSNSSLSESLNGRVEVVSAPVSAQRAFVERDGLEAGNLTPDIADTLEFVVGAVENLNHNSNPVKQEVVVFPKQQGFSSVQSSSQVDQVLKSQLKSNLVVSDYKSELTVKPMEQVLSAPTIQALSLNSDGGVSVGFKVALGGAEPKQSAALETTLADLPAKLKESIASNQTAMTIKLKPYELGRIEVQIKDVGGELQMIFKAEKPSTLDVLQSNESALRSTFKDGGSLELSYGGSGKEGSGRGGSDERDLHDTLPASFVETEAQLVSNSHNEIESRGLNLVV